MVARKFAMYDGDSAAPFVPFKAYYSTYADMSAAQLRFYFRWRTAFRAGEALPTDLSYIFVHTYELLHVVGAESPASAAARLERLWDGYRSTYPNLDWYLVRWIADLYAAEVGSEAAVDFVRRAVAGGAAVTDELMLVTDQYWSAMDYAGMPHAGIALLVGERRLGDTKFYREHNTAIDGRLWVDGAYREAMLATDRAFQEKHRRTLRDAAVEDHGLRPLTREAFQGAVYDWKRKQVMLGKVPMLNETSRVASLYRNAVRYSENLLRKERGFPGKLRGIELDPVLAKALDGAMASYIRVTKPRARVTIDLAKAQELARETADVRARLLEGIQPETVVSDGTEADSQRGSFGTPRNDLTVTGVSNVTPTASVAAGLLTDLAAMQSAVASLSAPSRALLEAIVAQGWEVPIAATALVAAAGGALVGPLVDEINERTLDTVGDVLLVYEGETLVLQEDYRDEVYFVLRGHLDGFVAKAAGATGGAIVANTTAEPSVDTPAVEATAERHGFGPIELRVLSMLAKGTPNAAQTLNVLATECASTVLLLVDRVNECGLACAYGDIILDGDLSPPEILTDARSFVDALLERLASNSDGAPHVDGEALAIS